MNRTSYSTLETDTLTSDGNGFGDALLFQQVSEHGVFFQEDPVTFFQLFNMPRMFLRNAGFWQLRRDAKQRHD